MANYRDIPWLRIAAESIAIVASILLAFSIDAWWESRQERDREVLLLETLLADLKEKREFLDRAIGRNEAKLRSATTLLRAATSDSADLDDQDIDQLLVDLLWYEPKVLWDSAPMNSIVLGGNDAAIQSVELVKTLSGLFVSISRIRGDAETEERFVLNALNPFISRHGNNAQLSMAYVADSELTQSEYEFPVISIDNPSNHRNLLNSLEFQNLLANRIEHSLSFDRTLQTRKLREQLSDAIGQLESELAH